MRFIENDVNEAEHVDSAESGSGIVRVINDDMSIRNGKYGNYIFYKTQKMKKPAFHSLSGFELNSEKCNIEDLKIWLNNTYNIS